jgi:hypothetical protein
MRFNDILIILGCVAAGYWIVRSVMGPGIDLPRPQDKPSGEPRPAAPQPGPASPKHATPRSSPAPRAGGMPDWYLVLDVLQSASRADIEAAFLRQQKKAQADRDPLLQERLKRARDAGLAHARQAGIR